MNKNHAILNSYADDFTKLLGVKCKVIGESGMLSMAMMSGEQGAVKSFTQHYDAKTLVKVCHDFLEAMRIGKESVQSFDDTDNKSISKSKVSVAAWDSLVYNGNTPIGAHCVIKLLDDNQIRDAYFSFDDGFQENDSELDKFGVHDQNIYYFAERGEVELKELMESKQDFIVLSYELAYLEKPFKKGLDFEMEITDHRETSGQLYVDIAPVNGNVDDLMAATFEINTIPGTKTETQCLHLCFDNDNVAATFFKTGDDYFMRLESGVTLEPIKLDDGVLAYKLS